MRQDRHEAKVTRNEALSRIDQTLLCLDSCVQHFAGTDPVLAGACEDSRRALIPLRSKIFNATVEEKFMAHIDLGAGMPDLGASMVDYLYKQNEKENGR